MNVIEHHIQKKIIQRLMQSSKLRFSELKPSDMESNIFMYHIKQLTKAGYIKKYDNFYGLTTSGKKYVDGLSLENNKPRIQPKLITVIALKSPAGQWLLAKRKVQPYIDTLMFPSGMQHWGEPTSDHVIRELYEKTGIKNLELTLCGIADIMINDDKNQIITHAVATVYKGLTANQNLPAESTRFQFCWDKFEQPIEDYMPGTVELLDAIIKHHGDMPFFIELSSVNHENM